MRDPRVSLRTWLSAQPFAVDALVVGIFWGTGTWVLGAWWGGPWSWSLGDQLGLLFLGVLGFGPLTAHLRRRSDSERTRRR